MNTRVVNGEPREGGVYIGRGSVFGNGHPIGKRCSLCSTPNMNVVHCRQTAIAAFRDDFRKRIDKDESFRQAVEGLRGKLLICFCAPLSCHGEVYVEYLEGSFT